MPRATGLRRPLLWFLTSVSRTGERGQNASACPDAATTLLPHAPSRGRRSEPASEPLGREPAKIPALL